MKYVLTISIVTFNNDSVIEDALLSIRDCGLPETDFTTIVVDNASTDKTTEIISSKFPEVKLIYSENVGFGAGHNKAIGSIKGQSEFHLVMNPDVYFKPGVLPKLIEFMRKNPEIGLTMPKILYPDNSIQYLCKMLPTPFDLIGRRFIPGFLKPLFKKRLDRYEFRDRDYNQIMEVPNLSGCFMMLRAELFDTVGVFDERFFLYLEDVDFSRRIRMKYKNMYYPEVSIYHHHDRASYKNIKSLKRHISSAVKYFNKWGWFFNKS